MSIFFAAFSASPKKPAGRAIPSLHKSGSFYAEASNTTSRCEKFNLLEARMSGERVASPTGPRQRLLLSQASPARRMQTTQLYSLLSSPSPTKPLQKRTAGSSLFSSPSPTKSLQRLTSSPTKRVVKQHTISGVRRRLAVSPELNSSTNKALPGQHDPLVSPLRINSSTNKALPGQQDPLVSPLRINSSTNKALPGQQDPLVSPLRINSSTNKALPGQQDPLVSPLRRVTRAISTSLLSIDSSNDKQKQVNFDSNQLLEPSAMINQSNNSSSNTIMPVKLKQNMFTDITPRKINSSPMKMV